MFKFLHHFYNNKIALVLILLTGKRFMAFADEC